MGIPAPATQRGQIEGRAHAGPAERDSNLRAVVDFAGAAASWGPSSQLRSRLLAAMALPVLTSEALDTAV